MFATRPEILEDPDIRTDISCGGRHPCVINLCGPVKGMETMCDASPCQTHSRCRCQNCHATLIRLWILI